MTLLKTIAVRPRSLTKETHTPDNRSTNADSPRDFALSYLKENGFCVLNLTAPDKITNLGLIAIEINTVEKTTVSNANRLLRHLFRQIPILDQMQKREIKQFAPNLETANLALRACYLLIKDFHSPFIAQDPLRFIRDYIRFGGMPFSKEISSSIHQHFQTLLPIDSLKKLKRLHMALRDIVPHADPGEYCFSRCVWLVDKLKKLGLNVGTIRVSQEFGLHPPHYRHKDIMWTHHIAPTVEISSHFGLISKTYILDPLIETPVVENLWFSFVGFSPTDNMRVKRDFSIIRTHKDTDISDFLEHHLKNETIRLSQVYYDEIRNPDQDFFLAIRLTRLPFPSIHR